MLFISNLIAIYFLMKGMIYKISFYLLLFFLGCKPNNNAKVTSDNPTPCPENSKHPSKDLLGSLEGFDVQSDTTALIFQTGFEPGTKIINQNKNDATIIGTDRTFKNWNNWKLHLERNPKIGYFNIQYQGGNANQRLAEIVPDPYDPNNNSLKFWIKEPNVDQDVGRVQANIYNNKCIKKLDYSVRLLLPSEFNNVKKAPFRIKWLTLMEFWNNANWEAEPNQFRITVNLQKSSKSTDSLRIGIRSQIRDHKLNKWKDPHVWDYMNSTFAVPVGKWMNIEVHFVEGDDTSGRFILSITPEGGSKSVIHDITNFTHHPNDPNPDGLSHFNPMKLYTSKEVIEQVTSTGSLLNVYWDDFRLAISPENIESSD